MSFQAEKHDEHKDDCKHKVTNYCKPCDEFYCSDCETTWTVTPCASNHYPWWNYTCGTCNGDVITGSPLDVGSGNVTTVTYPSDGGTGTSVTSNDVSFSFPT